VDELVAVPPQFYNRETQEDSASEDKINPDNPAGWSGLPLHGAPYPLIVRPGPTDSGASLVNFANRLARLAEDDFIQPRLGATYIFAG
jgi:hypothetical protein